VHKMNLRKSIVSIKIIYQVRAHALISVRSQVRILLPAQSMKKTKKKKLIPKNVRNKHAKEMRELLKNKKIKVNSKSICLS